MLVLKVGGVLVQLSKDCREFLAPLLDGVDARQRIREIMLMIRIAVTPLLGKITAVMIEIVKTALLGKFDDNTDCDDGCRRET